MTAQTRAVLKAKFETGDRPTGADFTDLIDSAVNLQDAAQQVFVSNINTPGLSVSTLSANNIFADNFNVSAFTITGTLSANTLNVTTVSATTVIAETVRTSAVRHKNPFIQVYAESENTMSVTSSANLTLSAITTSNPNLRSNFTADTGGRVTYTGSVTALMLVNSNILISIPTVAAFDMAFTKNSASIGQAQFRIDSVVGTPRGVDASFIIEMKTNDVLQATIAGSGLPNNYTLTINDYSIVVHPIHFP